MGGAQAMKRIPRIKFPQRHPKPSDWICDISKTPNGSESRVQAEPLAGDASHTFFSGSKASTTTTLGGKASLQPERTPVSKEEIEAILLGGCI
ncbi:PREDICTED: uncharacterized protein LOC103337639 isoform X1 [Prunus mume]|uniref:Uncharacterized protein LOC103337639 isoform X1 n=1 Tax=Prunus mume TaxID=102107 RepID=A0ABM0PFU4_PRUMU|nr:PREDICTED: uncharacterized protein LOC103337639 isoform X1 [Prunus mume]